MPRSAIEHDGAIDLVAPLDGLADEICRLVGHLATPAKAAS